VREVGGSGISRPWILAGKNRAEVSLLPREPARDLPPTARFGRVERRQSQAPKKRTLGACGASQEREGQMDRGGQAPRPARHIKHDEMALVGLPGHFWPISNTPWYCRIAPMQ
jgi:hypothetical protein